jgi:formate hydrogenlyase transcriptional activator
VSTTKPKRGSVSEEPRVELTAEVREQLKFERLLADLSASFVNLPANQVERAIDDAQRKICECLGIDHSAFWLNSPEEPTIFLLTHVFRDPNLIAPPDRMDGDTYFPWLQAKLMGKEIVNVPSIADLPPDASTDKKHWQMYGIKSVLGFPLWVGDDPIFGVLSFDATTEEREWPEALANRLQLLAQVFANALARQRTERALSDSETRLRLAAASANAGLWTLDSHTGQVWVTEKTRELFGLGLTGELDLRKFLALIHPEDLEAVQRTIDKAFLSGEDCAVEYRVIRPDGTMGWIYSRGRRRCGEFEEPDRLMGVSVDITERRSAEAALRESEERFRFVTNKAPVMIWMSGTDKLCTFFNQGWLDFTGRSIEQELGDGWAAGVHPDDLKRCLAIYSEAFDTRTDFKMEYRLRRFDGEFRWVVDHGAPRSGPDGKFVGYIGSCVDITESKVAQEELKNSYAEIKQLKEKLEAESNYLQAEIKDIGRFHEIVGQSKAIKEVLMKVEQVAGTDSVVLITGETGTGKELIARALHHLSKRKEQVMVKVDCAALPPTLIESELFGREKGAYTGALSKQFGRFETAHDSTIFLDEIGELGVEIQAKLLRVVQDGEFERLGSAKTSHVNVRLIAATHRDLAERVKNGTFREDLFYRLNVFPIHVPPLRERPEDIPLLVMAFLREFEKKMGKKIRGVPSRIMDELRCYPWPGNIRELRNVIERAVIVTAGEKLNLQLPKSLTAVPTRTLKEAEYLHILTILQKTGWRIKGPNGAATILGVKPSTLYAVMRRLHIPTGHEKVGISS